MSEKLSSCCKAQVRIMGDVTQYYVCSACKKACDTHREAKVSKSPPVTSRFLVEPIRADEAHKGDDIVIVESSGILDGIRPVSMDNRCLSLEGVGVAELSNDSVVLRVVRDTGQEQVDPAVIERYREQP